MFKITHIYIKRFRSNFDIKLDITNPSSITICGANNSGKTNTLRAINLFFNPSEYQRSQDVPYHKLEGSRGASQYPEIILTVENKEEELSYKLTRTFGIDDGYVAKTKGYDIKNKKALSLQETIDIIDSFEVFFIESINVNFPNLINKIINDVYEEEFKKNRISAKLRTAFTEYTESVLKKLNSLASEITEDFKLFNDNWGVEFLSNNSVRKFTDLINEDIGFFIKDKSNTLIESKGSGLQKLSFILLTMRIIEKIHPKKNMILLMDEPDTYLHDKVQYVLKEKINSLKDKCQIFVTTHSKVLIDTYTLKNVFLYDVIYKEKKYIRKLGKEIYQIFTEVLDLDNTNGAKKIKEYLGIEETHYDILEQYSILVEGLSDKKYLEEHAKYFNVKLPDIEYVEGADNFEKYLSFYNSIYKDYPKKPNILILFDNDPKGNEVYKKLISKKGGFYNINVALYFITNRDSYIEFENFEIEDILDEKIILSLTNNILKNANYNVIREKIFRKKCKIKDLRKKGILSILDICKSESNPDGTNIVIESENFKKNLAKKFSIQGTKKIIDLLNISPKRENILELLTKLSQQNSFFEEPQ